jgi:hypothetical protein
VPCERTPIASRPASPQGAPKVPPGGPKGHVGLWIWRIRMCIDRHRYR